LLASEITKKHRDYDIIWNNCQKFVLYLLENACPNCPVPTTLEATVRRLFVSSTQISGEGDEKPLPGTYPQSNTGLTLPPTEGGTISEYFTAASDFSHELSKSINTAIKSNSIDYLTTVDFS
jgi:hypothetical protein